MSISAESWTLAGVRRPVGELLRYWAEQRPDRVCCGLDDDTYSFAEMYDRARRIAAGVHALGIRPGGRVATLAPNRVEILELFYGLALAGVVQVPINPFLKGSFLAHQLTTSRPRMLLTDHAGHEAVSPILGSLPSLAHVVQLDADGASATATASGVGTLPYSELATVPNDAAEPDLSAGDPMSIVYTSGTTGLPKGCVLTHGYYCRSGQLNGDALELTDDDVLFCALPMFHGGGRLIVLMGGLYRGIPARVESAFSASRYLDRAAATHATVAVGVGPMGAALLASPTGPADRRHGLRTMMTAPMHPDAQRRFRDRFGIEPWTEVYGQTECMPVTMTPISSEQRDPHSCGLPAPDLDLALLDDDGKPVGDGEAGEICLRPKHGRFSMFDGYGGLPDETLASYRGLWYHTGDYGRQLPSGAIAFVDRKKDALRRRGENVSSIELENAINTHPAIAESAVHAVPTELGEDDIKACIVLVEGTGLDAATLFGYLKEHVPYYAVPRYVEILDALPRNAVGRVTKHALRDRKTTGDVIDFEALGLTIGRDQRR
jgi:carnitine-CoA ligase